MASDPASEQPAIHETIAKEWRAIFRCHSLPNERLTAKWNTYLVPEPSACGERSPGMGFEDFVEEIQVLGRDLVDKVRELIHEGNVRRIVVKDEHGNTFVEIPVAVAAVGAILAPVLAAVGAISALVAKFTIVVVRIEPKTPKNPKNPEPLKPPEDIEPKP